MALNAVLGSSTADSYITVAEADAIFASSFQASDWDGYTEADKEIALKVSTVNLEYLQWNGTRCSPSTDDAGLPQALAWPRNDYECRGLVATCASIPVPIKQACAYLALDIAKDPGSISGGGTSGTQGPIKMQQLGSLKQEFFEPGGSDTKVSPGAPLVLQKYPYLVDVLGCWLETSTSSSRVILRVRS
jgi:hypothetical protein